MKFREKAVDDKRHGQLIYGIMNDQCPIESFLNGPHKFYELPGRDFCMANYWAGGDGLTLLFGAVPEGLMRWIVQNHEKEKYLGKTAPPDKRFHNWTFPVFEATAIVEQRIIDLPNATPINGDGSWSHGFDGETSQSMWRPTVSRLMRWACEDFLGGAA